MLRTNIAYPTSAIREVPSRRKKTIFNLKLLLIFITSLGGPCAGIAWGADYSSAISAYHAGHVQQAKDALLSEIEKATTDDEKFSAANLLLDICGRSLDIPCVQSIVDVASKLANKEIHDPKVLLAYKFSIGTRFFASSSHQQQESFVGAIRPETYGLQEALAVADPGLFATTQLDVAAVLRNNEMPTEAVLATSRAIWLIWFAKLGQL